MGRRSQSRKLEVQGINSGGGRPWIPPITAIAPDTATLAAVGAVNRVIATLTGTGGVAPFTWSSVAAGGLSFTISGNSMRTSADPCGTVGLHTATIRVTDTWGQTKDETIAVTLT